MLFDRWDKNKNGKLDPFEIQTGLKEIGQDISVKHAKKIISRFDIRRDKSLDFEEFLLVVATLENENPETQSPKNKRTNTRDTDVAKRMFDKIDKNRNGEIDRKELAEAMRGIEQGTTDLEIDKMLSVADFDHKGSIDFPEFCRFLDRLGMR